MLRYSRDSLAWTEISNRNNDTIEERRYFFSFCQFCFYSFMGRKIRPTLVPRITIISLLLLSYWS